MRTGLRFALGICLLAACAAGAIWALNVRDEVDVKITAAFAPSDSLIARGAYLARAGNCMACHTARGGEPYAGGLGHRHALRHGVHLQPHARRQHRHRQLVIGAFLARPAQRPLEKRPPAVPGFSLHQLHPGHARGFGRDVCLPAQPAGGEPGPTAARAALSLQLAGRAGGLARAVLHAGRVPA